MPLIFLPFCLSCPLQNGICWSSDCLRGPRGSQPDRGHRVLRCPSLESVLLCGIQHCDCTGNEKLQPLVMNADKREEGF